MAMVGVGGSIGTGLLLGSGAAVRIAGPAVILSFAAAALITWTVAMALSEMATLHPSPGAFGTYAELYLNSWAGFVSRYGFWLALAIAIGGEMVASATYMHYWFPRVGASVWIVFFAAGLLLVNLRTVGDYGKFEYWFAMIKLVTMLAFVVLGAALLAWGRVSPQYTASGGFFPNGHGAPLRAMSFSLFTFAGIEMVAISSGESRSALEVSRAVRTAFALLTVVYMGAVVVLVGVMPWHGAGVTESPFVTVFRHVGLPAVSHVMNLIVLTAALSGANASLYADSRALFSLAQSGYAPVGLGKLTTAGAPLRALLISSCGIIVALVLAKWAPQDAFVYLLGAALFGAMLAWLVVLAAHVRFRTRISPKELAHLPVRSPAGALASVFGFIGIVVSLAGTWWYSRVTVVSGMLYVAGLSAAYFLARARRKR
jgi:L-asparagine transporter-like permease